MTGYNLNNKRQQGLSPREQEVFDWMGLGMTNDQIARKMNISYNTVRSHLRIIYAITGKTRYQIILEAKK